VIGKVLSVTLEANSASAKVCFGPSRGRGGNLIPSTPPGAGVALPRAPVKGSQNTAEGRQSVIRKECPCR
jgi:hypothetical protein